MDRNFESRRSRSSSRVPLHSSSHAGGRKTQPHFLSPAVGAWPGWWWECPATYTHNLPPEGYVCARTGHMTGQKSPPCTCTGHSLGGTMAPPTRIPAHCSRTAGSARPPWKERHSDPANTCEPVQPIRGGGRTHMNVRGLSYLPLTVAALIPWLAGRAAEISHKPL